MNWLPFCITQIYRYDGSAGVRNLFWFFCILSSGENCFWFPCFLFITEWLSFDSSGETTSGVTLAHSMVYFIYLWYIVTSSWSWTSRIKGHDTCFSNDTRSSTSLYITLHEVSMNFFFLNTFSFFLGLFYWATRFLSFDSRIFCHLLANLSPNFWLFLVLFRMAGTLVIMSKPYHVPHVSQITTNGKSFTETIFSVSNEMNLTFVTCFLVNEL